MTSTLPSPIFTVPNVCEIQSCFTGKPFGTFTEQIMKNIERELQFDYIRASGPGGQNVNKVATAVQLRFDVTNSSSLTADVKSRLVKLAGKRMTDTGVLIIQASKFRTQEKNREVAIERLYELVRKASQRLK